MDQHKKIELIGEVAHYISQGDSSREQSVIEMYKDNPDYDFLFPQSPMHPFYKSKKQEFLKQQQQQQQQIQQNQNQKLQQQQQYNQQQPQQIQQQPQINRNINMFPPPPFQQSMQQPQNYQNQQQQQYQQNQQQYQQQQHQQQQQQQYPGFNYQNNQQGMPQIYPNTQNQQNYQYHQQQQQQQQNNQTQNQQLHQQNIPNAMTMLNPERQQHIQTQNIPQNLEKQNSQENSQNQQQDNQNDDSQTKKRKRNKWSEVPPTATPEPQKQIVINNVQNQQQPQVVRLPQQQAPLPNQPIQQQQPLNLPQIPQGIQNIQSQQNAQIQNLQKIQQIQTQLSKNQKTVDLPQSLILEQYGGGLIAEVVKTHINKMNSAKIPIVPYTPIHTDSIVKTVHIIDKPKEMIKAKIEQLSEFLQKDKDNEKKRREEKEKEAQKEREIEELAMAGFEVERIRELQNGSKNRDISREVDELYQNAGSRYSSGPRVNQELGIGQDGRALNNQGGNVGLGMGSNVQTTQSLMQEDKFANYRKGRSYHYHTRAEERAGGSRDGVQLCYKCNRPGHIAKDCKFGLT